MAQWQYDTEKEELAIVFFDYEIEVLRARIPEIFGFFNEYYMRDRDDSVKQRYNESMKPEHAPKSCVRCGKCEELCPQHLPIRDLLKAAGDTFERR